MNMVSVGEPTFGLSLPMVGTGLSAGQLLNELVTEVQAAEDAGFDLVLIPEHHAGPPGSLTDPLIVAAWLLANSSRIRIGPGVLILPLISVPRLAEQAAILQNVSNGRFVLGVGAGYNPSDFARFGVDRNRRSALLAEGLRSLRAAWAGEDSDEQVRPALDTIDAPPLWLGAWSSQGVGRAAVLADGWIADPIHTHSEVATMATAYTSRAVDAHRIPHVVVIRELWIDEADEIARRTYAPVVEPIFRYYLKSGALGKSALGPADMTLDSALADRVICGGTESITRILHDFHSTVGASTYVFSLRHPSGPSHGQVLKAIERFGSEVLPTFRSNLSKDAPSTLGQGAMP